MPSRGQLFLALSSSLLGVLAFDFAYRALEPEQIVPTEIGEYSPTLGWQLVPGAEASSTRTGREVEYRINSKGIRDDETPYEKPEGTYRIAVIGDSRTFGYGVAIEQHFSRILEGYFERVEVINLGVSGYGIDQSFLFLQEQGFRYAPNLVIAYVSHFGDHRHMHSVRWGKPKPRFELVDGRLVLEPQPAQLEDSFSLLRRVDEQLVESSPLYRDTSQALMRLIKGSPVVVEQTDSDRTATASPGYVDSIFELGLAILAGIDAESRNRDTQFLVVTEMARLDEVCRQAGIRSFDVAASLANRRFELPDGLEHINEAGNGVLAWEIAQYLSREEIIPASHAKVRDDGPRF